MQIIVKARKNYLFEQYVQRNLDLGTLIADSIEARGLYEHMYDVCAYLAYLFWAVLLDAKISKLGDDEKDKRNMLQKNLVSIVIV